MKKTQYYELNKPDGSDYAKIAALNEGADKMDAALHNLEQGKSPVGHTHTPGEAGSDPAGSAAAVQRNLDAHAGKKDNPHGVTWQQTGAEQAGSTSAHNAGSATHIDIRNAAANALAVANEAKSLAEGRSRAVSYAGYSTMVAAVNIMTKTAMRVGDNLLIEAMGVPDLWVSKVEGSAVVYAYTTDEALEAALENGPVQMGYYKLTMLETPKVDLSGYVLKTTTINGKPLTANITLTAADVEARASTWMPTVAEIGLGKTLTFTGAATGTYNGTGDVSIKIPDGGGCVLQITFESAFSGKVYTVTGAGESYGGTVPAGLKVDVTVKNVDTEYTVSCDGATAKVNTGPFFGQYAVDVKMASTILNENTWAQIRKVSDAGTGANYWKVGDTKTIIINGQVGNTTFTNLSIAAFVLGFNHNSGREGNNRIHFQIGKIGTTAVALCDSNYNKSGSSSAYFQMNASNTNIGGWNGSSMRNSLLGNSGTPMSPPSGSLLAAFPSDLRAAMKSCMKFSDNTGGGSNDVGCVTASTDYLSMPSEFEIHGTRTFANSAEQSYQAQYDYYKAANSKMKYKHGNTGDSAYYWTRSLAADRTDYFCRVGAYADAIISSASTSNGIPPIFFL